MYLIWFDGAPCRCVTVQYPQSGALETLRLASARPVSGGQTRQPCSGLPPFRREHASGSFVLRLGLCAAKRSTTALPPAPTAPVPLSSRAAASLHPRTPRTRPGPGGLARRQRSRSCTTSAKQLLLQRTTRPHELTDPRWPKPVPSHGLCRAGVPSGAAASPQRAAPCTAHRSRKTSRDTHTAPAPPLPARRTIPQHSTRAYGA